MNYKGWESVGFQGKDPATDFRGGGVFGLEQLVHFLRVDRERALSIYKDSTNRDNWYFFAVTGINITGKLLLSLRDDPDGTNLVGILLDNHERLS